MMKLSSFVEYKNIGNGKLERSIALLSKQEHILALLTLCEILITHHVCQILTFSRSMETYETGSSGAVSAPSEPSSSSPNRSHHSQATVA